RSTTFLLTAPPLPYISTLSLHDALPISWCARSQTKKESQKMKKLLLSIAVAAAAPFAWAQVSETTTSTTTTTEGGGTITEFTPGDRKSTRLNSSHVAISYAVFCLKKKTT